MVVDSSNSNCTVIVTVEGEVKDIESVLDHASSGLARFGEFDGFIAGATHVSDERNRIVQYLQWTNKKAHEDCMNDSSWEQLESSQHFMELMKNGVIKVNVQTFKVVASLN